MAPVCSKIYDDVLDDIFRTVAKKFPEAGGLKGKGIQSKSHVSDRNHSKAFKTSKFNDLSIHFFPS